MKMSATLDEKVEIWVMDCPGQEIHEYSTRLELRTHGTRLQQAARLHNWLLGNYTASDFQEDPAASQAAVRRVSLRDTLIAQICESIEKEGEDNQGEPHPMVNNPQVAENLNRTTRDPVENLDDQRSRSSQND